MRGAQRRRACLLGASVTAASAATLTGLTYYTVFRPTSGVFGDMPYAADTPEKVVALTFDDGPNEPYTSRLLEVLASRDVRATFFQVGRCVERYPGISAAMAASGHVIGNHSYSHRFLRYAIEPSLRLEMRRTQDLLEAELRRRPALFRPPWLCHTPALMRETSRQGLQSISGTFAHPLEVAQIPADRIARGALRRTRPGSIVIFHDGYDARGGFRGRTVEAARQVVDVLAERGYRFVTVDELLGVPAYQGAERLE